MLFSVCEIFVPSSPSAFLLLALWVWVVSPYYGLLWERARGGGWVGVCVFYQVDDSSLLVGGLNWISSRVLLRSW